MNALEVRYPSTFTSRALRVVTLAVLGSWLIAVPGVADDADPEGPPRWTGLTLEEALDELRRRGLEILFTSRVVTPDMRVGSEPAGATPREILDQLLDAHGLEARAGPGGTLVVVPRDATDVPPAEIRGRVVERHVGRPLARVQILIPELGVEIVSDPDGRFALPGVPPGRYTIEARRPGFVVDRSAAVELAAGEVGEVVVTLVPAAVPLDEIVVTPSVISLLRSEPVPILAFDREEIIALPHLGDDLFRALTLLPGTSGNEFSAEFHVRGGRSDEVLVMLDRLELIEPFHLRDFLNALSIVPPQAIAEVELILGGFPARYGDRMGGVLDMRTGTPEAGARIRLGMSLVSAQAGGEGTFAGERGHWLGVARLGSFELVSSFLSPEEDPRYWDAFGKVEYGLENGDRIGLRLLRAEDRLDFDLTEDGDRERVGTDYGNGYLWLVHQAALSERLFADTVLSYGRIDRDRGSTETAADGEEGFTLRDRRDLGVLGLKQDWGFQPSDRHYLQWGFDLRHLESEYDYFNLRRLDDPLAGFRTVPRTGTTEFRRRLRGEQYGLYASDRVQLAEPLVFELGLRYDEHTVTGDRDLSPRLNLLYTLDEASTLRLAWGHFFQSQRLYELQVEDGETELFPAERTEQVVAGLEHGFARGPSLRVDAYYRDVADPRPRWENVFEPVSSFPEIEPDRVRIAPQRSAARGIELFLRGRAGGGLGWWVSYAYSEIEDRIDGRDVPRGIDQPHALTADLSFSAGRYWTVNLAFRYHTGWPTTAVFARLEENDEGELEPALGFGPLFGERLPDYHRLDLRASRQWRLTKGVLSFFFDVQNLYDRDNIAGFDVDFEFVDRDDGQLEVIAVEERWGGLLPSFGVEWSF